MNAEQKEFIAAERAAFAEYMKGWPETERMDDYKNMQWLGWFARAKHAALFAEPTAEGIEAVHTWIREMSPISIEADEIHTDKDGNVTLTKVATPINTERLRELAETASPGPWTASKEWPLGSLTKMDGK